MKRKKMKDSNDFSNNNKKDISKILLIPPERLASIYVKR